MNLDDTYISNYIKSNIKLKDRLSNSPYAINYKDLSFCFEFVGLTYIYLLCENHSMSYNLETSSTSCGCSVKDCIHKSTLKNYFKSLLDNK